MLRYTVSILALFASVQGRAVNISNTWVLPEEGFPVFYRYFRDRISWYEADAVCQFHHANLVTVDTTAQYDAVRAYLKELDITSTVWVGLIRSNSGGDFTWTDYHGLSGEGYWSSAPNPGEGPLCAAADPIADYRWEARACGGPSVASFICELPVPQWALGNEGCMIRALPALTVLYLPESAAVQLTADCGLAGVKRVQCTGNVKHETLLKGLSCEDDETFTTGFSVTGTTTAMPNDINISEEDLLETTTEERITQNHENFSKVTISNPAYNLKYPDLLVKQANIPSKGHNKNVLNKIMSNQNTDLDFNFHNNLQSNDIPKLANADSYANNELSERLEDEKHMQHKKLHEELARYGNPEIIFTQPTDRFVPPLVMAKAKVSDDMVVLSINEKHAQQLAEQFSAKNYTFKTNFDEINVLSNNHTEINESSDGFNINQTSNVLTDQKKFEKAKNEVPKKYNKSFDLVKSKLIKMKPKLDKTSQIANSSPKIEVSTAIVPSTFKTDHNDNSDDPIIDLTVIIKEPGEETIFYSNHSSDHHRTDAIQNELILNVNTTKIKNKNNEQQNSTEAPIPTSVTSNNVIINITVIGDDSVDQNGSSTTKYDTLTIMPVFKDDFKQNEFTTTTKTTDKIALENYTVQKNEGIQDITPATDLPKYVTVVTEATVSSLIIESKVENTRATTQKNLNTPTQESQNILSTTTRLPYVPTIENNSTFLFESDSSTKQIALMVIKHKNEENNITIEDNETNFTDTDVIDDFQSPLLSAASEPLHRPNRSRRPQPPPNRINKFNPFRILG